MSLTGINHYEQHIVFSNRIVHCVLDINPDQSLNNQLLWCSLITAYVVPFVLYQIYQVFSINMDFQTTINTLQAMCGALCITFTYASSNIQLETVKNLIAYIKHDYEHFLDKNELCILDKYTKLTKIYTIICVGFTSTYYFSLTLPSILDVGMHILGLSENMKLTLPFYVNNISSSGLVYYSMLLNELIIITIVLTIGCTIYLMYLVLILHASALFNMLIINIRQPFVDNKFIQNDWHSLNNKEESEWILQIIKKYIRITEYVNLINKLSKINYFIGACTSVFMIFFNILYVLQLPVILQKNIIKILECFVMVSGTIIIIYLNFHFGQVLIDHSRMVFDELYGNICCTKCQVPFYILSKKNQKLLLLITMRSIKPCELSIGGLFTASHEIFAGLMQKAFSFAMAYYSLIQAN